MDEIEILSLVTWKKLDLENPPKDPVLILTKGGTIFHGYFIYNWDTEEWYCLSFPADIPLNNIELYGIIGMPQANYK